VKEPYSDSRAELCNVTLIYFAEKKKLAANRINDQQSTMVVLDSYILYQFSYRLFLAALSRNVGARQNSLIRQ